MVQLPQIRTRRRSERVLDARMCVINECPFLVRGIDRSDGKVRYSCGAGVFRAQLPAEPLLEYIEENPEPIPGFQADTNPFLLRLLMARECLRPECGVCEIEYAERVLEIDPDELEAELFFLMRLAITLILLAFIAVIAVFIWQWWKARADLQKLRENPPQKIAMLIRLPREAEKSNVKMTRFFSRIERLISHDKDAIATNDNVISAALVGSGKSAGQAPHVRFILWSPPELAERVMMELQECYEGQAQVTELKPEDDPVGAWLTSHIELKALEAQIKEQES